MPCKALYVVSVTGFMDNLYIKVELQVATKALEKTKSSVSSEWSGTNNVQ